MPIPVKSVLTAFTDVEGQLRTFLDRVPFVPEHDQVWSPALASCLLEACSQLDSFWKASADHPAERRLDIRDHFVSFGASVAARWLVAWGDDGRELRPFGLWGSAGTVTKADCKPPPWWQAYNALKHHRWANIKEATIENAANAVAGLFLAIVQCAQCTDSLVEAGWFRSNAGPFYAAKQFSHGPENPELGITVESPLLSYASGSCHADFERHLVRYHNCTHRFGRWLEKKYKRSIM